jgi:hypothetical protein
MELLNVGTLLSKREVRFSAIACCHGGCCYTHSVTSNHVLLPCSCEVVVLQNSVAKLHCTVCQC